MIFIDDTAYNEFKKLLDDANAESYSVRIALDRVGCSGPIFCVYIDQATDEDDVETVKEITFISEKSLNEKYGGFIFVSNEENNGNGLGMKPVVAPSDGCSGCSGGCH